MSTRLLTILAAVAFLAAGLAVPTRAGAQTADEEAALILYESGRERFKDNDQIPFSISS